MAAAAVAHAHRGMARAKDKIDRIIARLDGDNPSLVIPTNPYVTIKAVGDDGFSIERLATLEARRPDPTSRNRLWNNLKVNIVHSMASIAGRREYRLVANEPSKVVFKSEYSRSLLVDLWNHSITVRNHLYREEIQSAVDSLKEPIAISFDDATKALSQNHMAAKVGVEQLGTLLTVGLTRDRKPLQTVLYKYDEHKAAVKAALNFFHANKNKHINLKKATVKKILIAAQTEANVYKTAHKHVTELIEKIVSVGVPEFTAESLRTQLTQIMNDVAQKTIQRAMRAGVRGAPAAGAPAAGL